MKKRWQQLSVFVIVLVLIGVACSSAPTQASPSPTTQTKSPEEVLKAVTEAVNRKDVDAATALLADDVTQTLIPAPSGTGIYQGRETMRAPGCVQSQRGD